MSHLPPVQSSAQQTPRQPLTAIVHGPQGCGKTRHADKLLRLLGLTQIVDDWSPCEPLTPGALHLTFEQPHQHTRPGLVVMAFSDALALANSRQTQPAGALQ